MKKVLLIGGACLLALALIWLFVVDDNTDDRPEIEAAEVDRGDITQIVSAVGSVRALNTVTVGSQLSGQVEALFADFNSPVQAGDLLARLDPQTFERRVQEAEANLAVATANVAIQAASITKAEANFANARREFERQQSLVERGSVSASALDMAEAAFLAARADIEIAQAQKVNAEASVLQRQAALEAARIDLERTAIRSPINGVVIERAIDIGQTVAASLQAPVLFTIAQDLSQIRIEASVDEADIGRVSDKAEARFEVDAFPGQQFNGRVAQVRLAPNEDQSVVTYTVVIDAANPGRRLLPGMTTNIDIITGRQENALRIDNAAVRFRPPDDMIAGNDTDATSGPRGRQPGGEFAETLDQLGLDDATRGRIEEDMRESFSQMRGLFASGADRDTIRQRMEQGSREVMTRHLNADQLERLAELQRASERTRTATLYSPTPEGRFIPHRVRLGISDDRYTEIISGDIAEGDAVVTRIRRTRG